jgi:hypothetical protein
MSCLLLFHGNNSYANAPQCRLHVRTLPVFIVQLCWYVWVLLFLGHLVTRGFLITHKDAPQSVGLLLDKWSARRSDLYLTTHNKQTSMPLVGFEPTIAAGERPQTYALDRAATGTGPVVEILWRNWLMTITCDPRANLGLGRLGSCLGR